MSQPFRSDSEALREQLRRAEDEIAALHEERARREDTRPFFRRYPGVALLVAALGLSFASAAAASVLTSQRHEVDLARVMATTSARCEGEKSALTVELVGKQDQATRCQSQLAECMTTPRPPSAGSK